MTAPVILHITASPCYGGPERQMLELGKELAPEYRSVYATFREEERCWDFVSNARQQGFEIFTIDHDTPRLFAAYREIVRRLGETAASVLVCHGYKAGILGRLAARRVGVPAIAVSRGWTGESLRVQLFDWLDRINLRWMDRVVCVSTCQASRVRKSGVSKSKIITIRNAVRTERFSKPVDSSCRQKLEAFFRAPPKYILGAAGRLSPEKGFDILIEACRQLKLQGETNFGMVLFGDGLLRNQLQQQIDKADLTDQVHLAGFTNELDRFMPHFDIFVQSSHTEGLPNVLLEAASAGIPVVATAVGGTNEVVVDGQTGVLVNSGDPAAIARGLHTLLKDPTLRSQLGMAGHNYVATAFSFKRQAQSYHELLISLLAHSTD